MVRTLLAGAVLAVALTSCGGSDGDAASDASTADLAAALQTSVPDITKVVEITEDNDTNDLIGRPGQYDQATFLASSELACDGDYNGLSVDCGAKLERWGSADDAKARMDDIQKKLKDYGLGSEWDYLAGRILLRVSGAIEPSLAAEYEKAFSAATD